EGARGGGGRGGGGARPGGGGGCPGGGGGGEGPGPAGAEKGVVARVAPALGDVHAGGAGHALVDDVVDAPRDRDQRQPHRLGQAVQRCARGRDVDRDRSAGE